MSWLCDDTALAVENHNNEVKEINVFDVEEEEEDDNNIGGPYQIYSRRKKMARAQDGVLKYMVKMMDVCKAKGFVYGIISESGQSVTGSSESLKEWWKETVHFDRDAATNLSASPVKTDLVTCLPVVGLVSNLDDLQDLQDSTLGSLLSALLQHCNPPQRKYPFEMGLAPPWWPKGLEPWWGVQGDHAKAKGPPPYRRPHDLKKAWKVTVLVAVIRHMGPDLEKVKRLVWQSRKLQNKISMKESEIWARVVSKEEEMVKETNGPGGDGRRKCEFVRDCNMNFAKNNSTDEEIERMIKGYMALYDDKEVDMVLEDTETVKESGLLVHGEEEDLWYIGLT